jgi:multidrug resistance protein MdtO
MSEAVTKYRANTESQKQGLLSILWDELKPYPGRDLATLRIAIACTVIVLVSNTFRLPYQDLLPFLVLFIAKEEKITTAITAVLALLGITIAVSAAILIFKGTGNRPEFRIPGMAVEIFVGMYLFRVLSIGPVGWIMAFIISVAESVVDLYPTPEEAVHWMLWVWVAVLFAVMIAWVATFTLFPVPAKRVLERQFVIGWQTLSIATRELTGGSPVTCRRLLAPLARQGPVILLKHLKFSLMESHDLRPKQKELTRLILAFDKIIKLTYCYSGKLLKAVAPARISSEEKLILGRITANAEHFEREFADGFVLENERKRARTSENEREHSHVVTPNEERVGECFIDEAGRSLVAPSLVEADSTLEDLREEDSEDPNQKPGPRTKKSLFVPDAFTNPRHVQFALKVTLAGMIGYIFYTASDYFGIHTVYYTPLIIALASTGATVHKGVLRIAGCIIGGAIGLICSIWVIPRFETLGMYLFIVFCLHCLAGWVAFGSDRISYMGLQIAIVFGLGVLRDYGPPKEIDPIRDRFIGIILGIVIISTVFSLVWPESALSLAREKLAACLRSIARLVHLGNDSKSEREQIELEIGSRLSEANSYADQESFEKLLYGSRANEGPSLEKIIESTEEIYVAALPWLREQAAGTTRPNLESVKKAEQIANRLTETIEENARVIESNAIQNVPESRLEPGQPIEQGNGDGGQISDSLKDLVRAVTELHALISFPRTKEY